MYFFIHKKETKSRLIISIGSEVALVQSLINVPQQFLAEHLVADEILLIFPLSLKLPVAEAINDPRVVEAFGRLLPHWSPEEIFALGIGHNGVAEFITPRSKGLDASAEARVLLGIGAYDIFERRDGLMVADSSCHFVKPSGKTTQWFLKTANVLVNSGEIDFLALGLLFFLHKAPSTIYCDTAGIHALAYSLRHLLVCQGLLPKSGQLLIESFNSYLGLEQFAFRTSSGALVLISSSTSGDLASRVVEKGIPAEQIITIFFKGDSSPHLGYYLCDLGAIDSYFDNNIQRRMANIHKRTSGSLPIVLQNEWFAVGERNTKQHLLTTNDAPPWLRKEQRLLIGRGLFAAMGRSATNHRLYQNLIRISHALQGRTPLRDRIKSYIQTRIPSQASLILADAEVKSLLSRMRWFQAIDCDAVSSIEQWEAAPEQMIEEDGPVVVITGSMRHGRRLLGVSRALRNITSKYNNRILYLNIFGLLAHQADYKELETNLTYGPSGPDHNVFCSVFKFCMGDAFSPWEQEQQKIREVLNLPKYRRKISNDDRASLSARMRQLSLAVTRDRDLLFFCQTAQEKPLILRDNFAFDFTAETDNRSSIRFEPSDVYFTISSVLHALRSGNSDKHALCQRVNSRCVLAPSNFDRFNDGLVQASILRAALPVELEYSIATEESRQMGEILQGIFANQDNVQGEAAAEFALALVLRRLKLQDEDIERLFAKSGKTKGLAGAFLRIFRVEHD